MPSHYDAGQTEICYRLPLLKESGILNKEITQTMINSNPSKIAFAFAVQLAPTLTHSLFQSRDRVSRCSFRQRYKVVDDYGNDKELDMFTYSFDRETDKRVNWERLESANFYKIATRFVISPAFQKLINEE